jgi:iron(III) transport system permease protein
VGSPDTAATAVEATAAPRAPTQAPAPKRRAPVGLLVVCAVVGLLFVAPLLHLLLRTIGGEEDVWALYTSERTLEPLRNTLILATSTALSSAVVGTALAWLTARTDLPLRRLWAVLSPLPLVFPSFVGSLALIAAVGPGGLLDSPLGWFGIDATRPEGFLGAWFVLTLFTTPYVMLPVAARLVALPPSLEESARLLGRPPLAVFRSVVLPQISTAIAAGGLLVFLYTLSDFGVVTMLRYETLTRSIYVNRLLDSDQSIALSLLLGVCALLVVAGERAVARRRPPIQSVRTRDPLRVPLGKWRWPALGLVVAWVGVALVGPLASLAYWASRDFGGTDLGDLSGPAYNTVWIGLVTALVAVAVVLPVAYLTSRHGSRSGDMVNGLVAAGFALPGVVVGLAVVSWAVDLPRSINLYQSFTLLVAAYVIHLGMQSLRAAQVSVEAVPRRLDESARVLGAGRLRRVATVDLPLMTPGLAAGGGLVLLSTMKELPITLFVRPNGFETLSTRIWSTAESGSLARPGMASLVLVALSAVLTWLLVVRRAERLG